MKESYTIFIRYKCQPDVVRQFDAINYTKKVNGEDMFIIYISTTELYVIPLNEIYEIHIIANKGE